MSCEYCNSTKPNKTMYTYLVGHLVGAISMVVAKLCEDSSSSILTRLLVLIMRRRSQIVPADPHNIGFRRNPTPSNQTIYEIEEIEVAGLGGDTVTPCFLITVFFYVDKPGARRAGGGGLHLKTPPAANKRQRRCDRDGDEDMDDLNNNGNGRARIPRTPGLFGNIISAFGFV